MKLIFISISNRLFLGYRHIRFLCLDFACCSFPKLINSNSFFVIPIRFSGKTIPLSGFQEEEVLQNEGAELIWQASRRWWQSKWSRCWRQAWGSLLCLPQCLLLATSGQKLASLQVYPLMQSREISSGTSHVATTPACLCVESGWVDWQQQVWAEHWPCSPTWSPWVQLGLLLLSLASWKPPHSLSQPPLASTSSCGLCLAANPEE